jgi:hypothetical protein
MSKTLCQVTDQYLNDPTPAIIQALTVFVELARARQQAQTWAGSMYWKQQNTC